MLLAGAAVAALAAGCASLDERQRAWIFQPTDRVWAAGAAAAEGMADVWIAHDSRVDPGRRVTLHGLWLPAARADAPVLLYLHGARWDVRGSAPRMRRLHQLGFSVLAVDYRGFGRSTSTLPSEAMAVEDADAAWRWLREHHPQRERFLFGHSLGSAIAVDVASRHDDVTGLIVEGSFPSMADVISTFRFGWLPVQPLLTQRFEAAAKIGRVKAPIIVAHGSDDQLIVEPLGRALYDAAPAPKRWLRIEGGTHHDANARGLPQYRAALDELFGDRAPR